MQLIKPLKEVIRPTTIIEAPRLARLLGVELTIASETFQFTGSFKFRAAYNLASKVREPQIIAAECSALDSAKGELRP